MSKLVDYYKLTLAVLAAVLLLIYFTFNPPMQSVVVAVEPHMQHEARVRLALKKDMDYRIYISPNATNSNNTLTVNGVPMNSIFESEIEVRDSEGGMLYDVELINLMGEKVSLGGGRVGIEATKKGSNRNDPLRLSEDGKVRIHYVLKPLGNGDEDEFDPNSALYIVAEYRDWWPRQPVRLIE